MKLFIKGVFFVKKKKKDLELTTDETLALKTKQTKEDESSTESSSDSIKSKRLTPEEREQQRLEKSYAKPRLGERIWLVVAPLAVLSLIVYYGYIGCLAYKHTMGSKPSTTDSSQTEEAWSQEDNEALEALIEELEQKNYQGFSNYNNLNVRAEPSEQSEILGTLSLNEEVTILELATETLNWHKIDYQGQEAYVREDFVVVSDLTELPVEE